MLIIQTVSIQPNPVNISTAYLISISITEVMANWNDVNAKTWNDLKLKTWNQVETKYF